VVRIRSAPGNDGALNMLKHRINLRGGKASRLKHTVDLSGRKTSRAARIAQLILFGLFWNGIVAWVYIAVLSSLVEGGGIVLIPLLFLTPFIGAGIRYFLIPLILELADLLGFMRLPFEYDIQKNEIPPIIPPISFWGGVVQLVVAGWMIITGLIPTAMAWMDIRSWEPIPCEILSSKVVEVWKDGTEKYDVSVQYRYLFGSWEYVGEKYVAYGTPMRKPSSVEKKIKKYPAGSKAICYVNTEDPDQAVLSRDIRGIKFARGGLGGIVWLAGAIAFGIGMRTWVKNFPDKRVRRPERIAFWTLLLIGWGVFSAGMIIGDICGRMEEGQAATPGTGVLVFFGAIGLAMLYRLLYHILVKWDRIIVLSPADFHKMHKDAKKRRHTKEKDLS
jgi:hypothetical protein